MELLTSFAARNFEKKSAVWVTQEHRDTEKPGMSFVQVTKREMMKKGLCFKCKKRGHKAVDCPNGDGKEQTKEVQQLQAEGSETRYPWSLE